MDISGASSSVRSAASSWPRSRRAPASTIVISAFASGAKFATDGLLASFSASWGLPSARWQSAMIGRYAVAPFIRFAARSSASASA